jgi:putative membrane protein insertion efficiency factor
MTGLIVFALRAYQKAVSPFLGGACRFVPSCSEYAAQAFEEKGLMKGTLLTVRRLSRCHPLGGHGFDPVGFDPVSHDSL